MRHSRSFSTEFLSIILTVTLSFCWKHEVREEGAMAKIAIATQKTA
jgi:hypothetical protein